MIVNSFILSLAPTIAYDSPHDEDSDFVSICMKHTLRSFSLVFFVVFPSWMIGRWLIRQIRIK